MVRESDVALTGGYRRTAAVLSALDSIAWAFNVRGEDVSRTPVALAFALLPGEDHVEERRALHVALVLQQLGKHDQVPLLEDPKAQGHVREQHRTEWKHRHDRHRPSQPPGPNR